MEYRASSPILLRHRFLLKYGIDDIHNCGKMLNGEDYNKQLLFIRFPNIVRVFCMQSTVQFNLSSNRYMIYVQNETVVCGG